MKKKLDVMTVISIVLIVINLVIFIVAEVNSGSCESEFANGISLLNFGQLFSSTVYAIPPELAKTNTTLYGVIRNINRFGTKDSFLLVFCIDNISINKVSGFKR